MTRPTTSPLDLARRAWRWLARWPHGLIAAWLVIQLVMPLHYYLLRRDPHDERFAWRMFSPTRSLHCSVEMRVGGTPIVIKREFHDAWEKIAERGRRSVVSAMGAHLCHKYPGKPVTARLMCQPLRGEPYPVGGFDLCTIPEL